MEVEDSETDENTNACPICLNSFDSLAEAEQHWKERHTAEEILDEINKKTSQQLPTSSNIC